MNADEIPKEILDILDERAGKKHRLDGPVVDCLAEILTEHREIVKSEILLQLMTQDANGLSQLFNRKAE